MTLPQLRFLLDEMYPPDLAELLRERGVDAVAVKEVPGWSGTHDDDLLNLAGSEGRVVVTENIHDFAILALKSSHVGIVFCHPRRFPRDADHRGRLVTALTRLVASPPVGLGEQPIQWWLEQP